MFWEHYFHFLETFCWKGCYIGNLKRESYFLEVLNYVIKEEEDFIWRHKIVIISNYETFSPPKKKKLWRTFETIFFYFFRTKWRHCFKKVVAMATLAIVLLSFGLQLWRTFEHLQFSYHFAIMENICSSPIMVLLSFFFNYGEHLQFSYHFFFNYGEHLHFSYHLVCNYGEHLQFSYHFFSIMENIYTSPIIWFAVMEKIYSPSLPNLFPWQIVAAKTDREIASLRGTFVTAYWQKKAP